MINSQSSVSMELLLEFEAIFPNDEPLSLDDYLTGGKKDIVLAAASAFLGFKQYESKFENNRDFLLMFFSPGNNAFAKEVYSKIRKLEQKSKVRIVNPYTSLKLFEYFFSKPLDPEIQDDLEFEQNLFKAYLVLNSQFTTAQKKAFDSTEALEDNLRTALTMLSMHYPVSDKVNFEIAEIWVSQLIKAVYLFEFLAENPKTKPLLSAFLSHFRCDNWKTYLKRILPLTTTAVKNQKEFYIDIIIPAGEHFAGDCEFVEKLVIQESYELEQDDFLTTRATPFYKVSEGVYRIIFNLFVVEKIFKGVYFLLRDVNNHLAPTQKIANWKSLYCYEFSEKILLYKIIPTIYPVKCLRFTGQELADAKIDGAPDYYLRKGKDILLFESKDFLIRADLKASFDFAVYEKEFGKTLYYEELPGGKEKAGAVMQLIASIKRLLSKRFKADSNYFYKDVYIYPVIITHDHQYDTPGLHELVNSWFQDELALLKEEGFFVHHVFPVTIIGIDILFCYQASFSQGIYLHDIIREYQALKAEKPKKQYTDIREYEAFIEKKIIPFSLFLREYIGKHNLKKAPQTKDLVSRLLS